ncbi:MAG: hypothetical protein WD941_01705 [Opitutus sp.]
MQSGIVVAVGFLVGSLSPHVSLARDSADEVARIHIEAMGGAGRIAALAGLRATGHVTVGGRRVRFTMVAARPNRVRVETQSGGRTLVQSTDGVEAPWEYDTATLPPRYRIMPEATARAFAANAEFDNPLVAGASRGYAFDFAALVDAGDRKLLRVLVTRNLIETFSLMVDPETYLIAMRVEHRISPGGRRINIVTRFDDFRPVDGILLPHQVTVEVDGTVTQQTKIDRMDGNPELPDGTFTMPKEGAG